MGRLLLCRLAACLGLCAATAPVASAQFNTAAVNCDIGANEYGAGNANAYASGTPTWYMTWDDTYLYVSIQNANETEAGLLYLDWDPLLPVNGGGTANGNLTGLPNYDGLTPDLPFRADAVIYFKNDYRELRRRNGSGGWTSISSGAGGLGGGSSDYSEGHYCSNGRGNGPGNDDDRELRISWNRLTGGGPRPARFNWNGYVAYSNGIYGEVPVENPDGTLGFGATPDFIRYFTVTSTASGASTNPVSQNSYTHLGGNVSNFGAISVYDFTMNTAGFTITRSTSAGGDWTIAHDLVVADGTVSFGGSGGASYGATTVGHLKLAGNASNGLAANGTLDMGYTNRPLVVLDSLYTFDRGDGTSGCGGTDFREPNVFLSYHGDGDIEVEGELAAYDEASVTTRTGGGELLLTADPGRLATIAPPAVIGGLCAGGSGVTNNDLVYERYYNGTQGYRFVGAPLNGGSGQTFETLNDDFHTQGATACSDFNFGGDILFSFDPTALSTGTGEQDRFVPVENYCATMGAGTGYAFYAYASAPGGGLPTRWDVKGQERFSDLSLTLPGYGGGVLFNSAFNFVANPYAGHLDWVAVRASSLRISNTYQVWNPDKNGGAGGYEVFTAGVDTHPTGAGRYIPPGQGFFVEASGASAVALPVVEFRQGQKVNSAAPNVFGREQVYPHLRLALGGEGLEATPLALVFAEEASPGPDPLDASLLASLGSEYVTLAMAEGERALVVQGVPAPDEALAVPLHLSTTRAGTYTLTWPDLSLVPPAWTLTLTDLLTGEAVALRERPSYTFTTSATAPRRAESGPALGPAAGARSVERFVLEVEPGATSAPVVVAAQPVGGPVVIGPSGGSFSYTVALTNTTAQSQTVQAWSAVAGPVDRDPVGGPVAVTLPGGATATWTLTQRVPANAPAGLYTYAVNVGSFPDAILSSDAFPFMKEGPAPREGAVADGSGWAASGWESLAEASATTVLPGGLALSAVSPNPFRGLARFTLELAEAQAVTVGVFDVLGRRVAVLFEGALSAGAARTFTLDGHALSAGVYVLRVDGERVQAARPVTVRH